MRNLEILTVLVSTAALTLLQACATTRNEPALTPPAPATPESIANLDAAVADAAREYTRVERNGTVLFCKQERPSGSNIMSTVCLTEAQLRGQVESARRFRDDRMQQGRRCAQGAACGNSG